MSENSLTAEGVARYLKMNKKRGELTLHVLGMYQPFVDAWNSEIGRQVLDYSVGMLERTFMKIADETATAEERADYRAYQRMIKTISERLATYEKNLDELVKK
jgi:hypothetical protein